MFKLGKTPARLGAVKFAFASYFNSSVLPVPPRVFGNQKLIDDWQILGNDHAGDCVWCDAAHSVMLWRAQQGEAVRFTEANVLSDYTAVTGYDPANPDSDTGTDLQTAAAYRQKTGVVDALGVRHKIDAYVSLQAGNVDQLMLACFLFGAVSIGIQLPGSAFDQFDRAEPWWPVSGVPIEGGHCITIVGRNSHGLPLAVTWGRLIAVSNLFLSQYMDEGIACFSLERLRGNVSPQGFDSATLQADLALLRAGPQPD